MGKRRVALSALLGALLTGAIVANAPPANADNTELVYLQLLNMRGFSVYNTALTLASGYQACEQLNYTTGDMVIPWMVNNYIDMSYLSATTVVLTAVETLCPWHDHRQGM